MWLGRAASFLLDHSVKIGAAVVILAGLVWFVRTHDLMAWIPLILGFVVLVSIEVWSNHH